MFDYDFNWHVGDRFTLVSDGFFDFFSQGCGRPVLACILGDRKSEIYFLVIE